jgi:hypothetical protein
MIWKRFTKDCFGWNNQKYDKQRIQQAFEHRRQIRCELNDDNSCRFLLAVVVNSAIVLWPIINYVQLVAKTIDIPMILTLDLKFVLC